MKSLLRSKLVLTLAAFLMIAAAVVIPLTSPITRSHAAPARRQLFIVLQGINSTLSPTDAAKNNNLGKVDAFWAPVRVGPRGAFKIPAIVPYLQKNGFGSAQYQVYSYPVDFPKDTPASTRKTVLESVHPYSCVDTFTHTLDQDARTLDLQIKHALSSNPNTDIYLIGHSLGGVVEMGYVAFLVESLGGVSLPSGAALKAVVTLDSPIGGVRSGSYFELAKAIYTLGISPAHCPGLTSEGLTSTKELTKIFASASKDVAVDDSGPFVADPQGAGASILAIPSLKLPASLTFPSPLGNPLPTNEELAEQAQTQFGTSFLTIGNQHDFTWDPAVCVSTLNFVLKTNLPSNIQGFLDTQWLEDEGSSTGLYGRNFTAGSGICPFSLGNVLNHLEVLNNRDVESGLLNFLTPITTGTVGGTPTPLSVPSGIQPEP